MLNILICQRLLWRIKLNSNNQITTLFSLNYILTIEFCNIIGVGGKGVCVRKGWVVSRTSSAINNSFRKLFFLFLLLEVVKTRPHCKSGFKNFRNLLIFLFLLEVAKTRPRREQRSASWTRTPGLARATWNVGTSAPNDPPAYPSSTQDVLETGNMFSLKTFLLSNYGLCLTCLFYLKLC